RLFHEIEQFEIFDDVDGCLGEPPFVQAGHRAEQVFRPAALHQQIVVPKPNDFLLPWKREMAFLYVADDIIDWPHAEARIQVGNAAKTAREWTPACCLKYAWNNKALFKQIVSGNRQTDERRR